MTLAVPTEVHRTWLEYTYGELLRTAFGRVLAAQVSVGAVLCLVPAVLFGLSFPAIAIAVSSPEHVGRSLGRVTVANTAGTVAGSLLAGFVLVPGLVEQSFPRAGRPDPLTVAACAGGDGSTRAPSPRAEAGASHAGAMIEIRPAALPADLPVVRRLLREYADGLGVDLCFQDFEAELASLPGKYAPPRGRLLLAWNDHRAVGCVALRPIDDETCEMKRLYVQPEERALHKTWRGRPAHKRSSTPERARGSLRRVSARRRLQRGARICRRNSRAKSCSTRPGPTGRR